MELTGRTILVTGASSGIGRAVALLCSQLGARLVLVGRDVGRLEETKALLEGDGHAVEPFDLSKTAEIGAWMSGLLKRSGSLRGLVHCAAVQRTMPLRVLTAKVIDEHWQTNVVSAVSMLKALQTVKHPDGCSVVLMSSSAAVAASPGNSIYSATKGAVSAFTRSSAIELLPLNIRVNCIEAALVETPMAARERENMSPEMFAAMMARHPMGMGRPEDVANAAAFLLADTSRWMTGSAMAVDGGFTAL